MRKNERRLLCFSGSEGNPLGREDGDDDHATNKVAILQQEFTAVIRLHKFSNVYRK